MKLREYLIEFHHPCLTNGFVSTDFSSNGGQANFWGFWAACRSLCRSHTEHWCVALKYVSWWPWWGAQAKTCWHDNKVGLYTTSAGVWSVYHLIIQLFYLICQMKNKKKKLVNILFFYLSECTKHRKLVFIFIFSAQYRKYNKQGNQNEIMYLTELFHYCYAISHATFPLCGHALRMRNV